MTAEFVHVHVFVSGRVQGVGYRASTYQVARQLSLKGWVRNLSDGRVEAVFEGDRLSVDRMLDWCRQGSSAAIVQDVSIESGKVTGLETFEIRR
jgi:acylphosphatase